MKIFALISAGLVAAAAIAPVSASAQRVVVREHGRHWDRHHDRRVCRTEWRHHHRVQICGGRHW